MRKPLIFSKAALACIAVATFQFALLYPLHATMDLPLWDESNYMGWGADFAFGESGLGRVDLSPLYVLLYSIFVRAFGRFESIFIMKYFLTIGLSLLMLAFLTKTLRSYSLSVLLSLLWSISHFNLTSSVMVYHFGAGVFLLALICCNENRLASALLLLLCVFIRMEYIFVFVPYLACLVITSLRQRGAAHVFNFDRGLGTLPSVAVVTLLLITLIYLAIKIDIWNVGGKRNWHAFRAHYATVQAASGRYPDLIPSIDYNIVIDDDFPGCESLLDAAMANPRFFASHIGKNICRLPAAIWASVRPYRPASYGTIFSASCLFIGSILACAASLRRRKFLIELRSLRADLGILTMLSLVAPMALLPSLTVLPKPQYSLALMPFIFLYVGIACVAAMRSLDWKSCPRVLNLGFLCLCGMFGVVLLFGKRPFENDNPKRPVHAKLTELNRIWPQRKVKLLGVGASSYANYLGRDRCIPVEPLATVDGGDIGPRKVSLNEMIAKHRPEAVLVNWWLVNSRNFDRSSLRALTADCWAEHDLGDDKLYFLKRKTGETGQDLK